MINPPPAVDGAIDFGGRIEMSDLHALRSDDLGNPIQCIIEDIRTDGDAGAFALAFGDDGRDGGLIGPAPRIWAVRRIGPQAKRIHGLIQR